MSQEMRRKERQLSREATIALLEKGEVCHLALVAQGEPYLVTLNYGYREGVMYFHCAREGRKMDFLSQGSRVCFSVVPRHELVVAEAPCNYSMKYESVVGSGTLRFLEEREEKRRALAVIMGQYAPGNFDFPEGAVARTRVFAVDVEELSGKSSY